MKKLILALLLAVTSLVTYSQTVVLKKVTFNVPNIEITKDNNTIEKSGTYQFIFSDTAGIMYFNDSTEGSTMRLRIGKRIGDQGISVSCNNNIVDATAIAYDAVINGEYDVTFVMVLLDEGAKIYAVAINLSNYTLSMRLDNSMLVYNK